MRHTGITVFLTFFAVLLALATIGCSSSPSAADMAKYQRALDVQEIQNLMSRHAYYYSAGLHQRELDELWAMKTPGVTWGSDEGYWVGADLIQDYYVRYFDTFRARDLEAFSKLHPEVQNVKENYGAGTSMFHTNSTPVIEVAEDGQTAKGIWYSVGQVTQTPGGVQTPTYMWERYGVDFTKEDGKWKIWHLFIHTDWSAQPGESWVRGARGGPGGAPGGPGAGGERGGPGGQGAPGQGMPPGGGQAGESSGAPAPTIRNARGMGASPYAPPSEVLKVPLPYKTFSETFSYGPPEQ